MKKVSLTVFNDNQLPSILDSFGIKTVSNKNDLKSYLADAQDNKIQCDCCGTDLHISNVGNIMKGSMNFYCKNPACYAHYLISKKL